MKIETQAVNTNGLWYALVLINDKVVYQGKYGFYERDNAIEEAKGWVTQTYQGNLL